MLTLQNATRSPSVPTPRTLRRWARAALRRPAAVAVRVVGTAEGRQLNRTWRGRDYATNVLSFAYGSDGGLLCGDLVLCAPVLAREARQQGKRLIAHYAHLVVHGLLHLQGEDHESESQALRMEARERRILKSLGYADPYRGES
jgi:probable rRNA maturation factor